MIRYGQPKPLVFDLIRDEIPHPSIDLKFEIRPGIGYIHLTQFQETTGEEMDDAINSFGNLKGLLLDLRENPGGLLSQAVDVCDRLLAKGQTIVTQRGRAYPDQNYAATHGNGGKTFPIVVLVNRDTASAAEIVSGALQDHDRALIVGETTFGKGLVQTVYNLSENTGLALTTYHYYTPSGRLIQRNYEGVSLYDYYNHAAAGPLPTPRTARSSSLTRAAPSTAAAASRPTKRSSPPRPTASRTSCSIRTSSSTSRRSMWPRTPWTRTSRSTTRSSPTSKSSSPARTSTGPTPTSNGVMDWLKAHIKKDIVTIQFGQLAGLRVIADWDPMVQKALTYMPEAQALEDNAHKVLAQKAQARDRGNPGRCLPAVSSASSDSSSAKRPSPPGMAFLLLKRASSARLERVAHRRHYFLTPAL